MTDQIATYAVCQELGSTAPLMSASRVLGAVAIRLGFYGEQSYAPQAYKQTELKGGDAWIELPSDHWPPGWT